MNLLRFSSLSIVSLSLIFAVNTVGVANQATVTRATMKPALTITEDFSNGSANGWATMFSDYPAGEEVFYELQSGVSTIPDVNKKGFKLSGNNHSDDLWMSVFKKYDASNGIKPNTTYKVDVEIGLATNQGSGSTGIGGSPATSVFIKAGVVSHKPENVRNESGYFEANYDKGNQGNEGAAVMLGTMATDRDADGPLPYIVSPRVSSAPLTVTSNANGEIFVYVGSDSGFEGTTTLYLSYVKLSFAQ